MNFKLLLKWLTRVSITSRQRSCRPPRLSVMPLAATADRVLEGRDCLHADWQAPSAGDRSAGLAAEVWLLLVLRQICAPPHPPALSQIRAPAHLRCFSSFALLAA